ncbi:MAG: alkane 1-monooxygenase [Lentilitoribacter sp.]
MPILAPFVFASLLPAILLLLACGFGGIWPFLAVLSITVLVFILDRRLGEKWELPQDASGHFLSICIGFVHFGVLAACVWGISKGDHLSVLDRLLIFTGAGLWFGQVSNSNAHELIHRSARWPRRLGVAIYCSLLFGHHASAHPKVHHVHAATDQDPNSARLGEGFYRFFVRAWIGGFRAGLKAENIDRARSSRILPAWQHPYVAYVIGGLATIAFASGLGGFKGIVTLLVLTAYAQIQLFLSDYVQHYGLRRSRTDDGRVEPMGAKHSWNAPHRYSSAMMLNAPRHSDHHMRPTRSFPSLEIDETEMLMLPHALPVMACLALVPKLWRRVMDKRVAHWVTH